MMMMMIHS